MGCIYLVTNKVNGKSYVGKTKSTIASRRLGHHYASKKPTTAFHNALRKYGFDAFEWTEVYSDVPDDKLDDLERECIKWFGTKAPRGYNLTDGGDGLSSMSREIVNKIIQTRSEWSEEFRKEVRRKLRESHLGYSPTLETRRKLSATSKGRKMPERSLEWRRNKSVSMSGRKHSEETKAKMSATRKRLGLRPPSRKGIKHSEETKARIRNSYHGKGMTGRHHSQETIEKIRLSNLRRSLSKDASNAA